MSFAYIRAKIETQVNQAFSSLTPAVPVIFDNVQDESPGLPYVLCLISYNETTLPVVHFEESMIEQINGNLQLSCYSPTGQGMGSLEDLASTAMGVMVRMKRASDSMTTVVCGAVNGPQIRSGSKDAAYALATVSCSFQASFNNISGFPYYTNQVLLP